MAPDLHRIGGCPKCGSDSLTCRYNHFERDELRIDSWEHKCPDCGHRETTAYRSDEDDSVPVGIDPRECPYCGRVAVTNG